MMMLIKKASASQPLSGELAYRARLEATLERLAEESLPSLAPRHAGTKLAGAVTGRLFRLALRSRLSDDLTLISKDDLLIIMIRQAHTYIALCERAGFNPDPAGLRHALEFINRTYANTTEAADLARVFLMLVRAERTAPNLKPEVDEQLALQCIDNGRIADIEALGGRVLDEMRLSKADALLASSR
jgi:hypothetical protein